MTTENKNNGGAENPAKLERLLEDAMSIAEEAKADLEEFEPVLRVETEEEVEDKDGNTVRVLIVNTDIDNFYPLFNRYGNPVEYLAPDSPEMTAHNALLNSGDVQAILQSPYEYDPRGYRVHTGKMTVYKDAMSNISLTPTNLKKIGQAGLSALDGHIMGFFYLNRVSSLKSLLGQAKRDFTSVKNADIQSL